MIRSPEYFQILQHHSSSSFTCFHLEFPWESIEPSIKTINMTDHLGKDMRKVKDKDDEKEKDIKGNVDTLLMMLLM